MKEFQNCVAVLQIVYLLFLQYTFGNDHRIYLGAFSSTNWNPSISSSFSHEIGIDTFYKLLVFVVEY